MRLKSVRKFDATLILAVTCVVFSGFISTPVYAEESAVLEEIIITSRRYEESINDAPVSVSVMSQDFLDKNRIDRADDIFNYTPGATYESFSKMQPVASMRGIIAPTPGNASSESSIQTVFDSVVITKDFMKSPPMYDMARIEVLRGPQGTAFGRNASIGLLHFVTNRPDQQETNGSISGTIGSDERFEINGHYNTPLSDTAALRVSFNHDQEDGQTESISTGEGLDGEQNTAIRVQLGLEPSDNFSANFKVEYSEDRDEAPVRHGLRLQGDCETVPYVTSPPYQVTVFDDCNDPFRTEISPEGPGVDFHTDRDILTLAAEFSWAFDNGLNLTSVTGYMDGETDNLQDVIGTINDVNWQFVSNDGDSLSTELRLDNVGTDSGLQWLAGVYLLTDEETRVEQLRFQQRGARGGPFVPTTRETGGTNETESFSVFGEISYDIGDRATITYGGRYVTDDKDYITRASGFGVNRQLGGLPGVGPGIDGVPAACPGNNMGPPNPGCGSAANPLRLDDFAQSDSWDDYISKLSIDYTLNDSTTIYGLYSEGFKSGTFQPDALNQAQASVRVEPETSTNFEIGVKGEGDRYRYSLTAFYLEVDDVQTINLVPAGAAFVGLISNVGSVETAGLELDGAYAVTDSFTLSGNIGLVEAEMRDTLDPTGLIDPSTGQVLDLDGARPAGSPEYTFNLIAEYNHAMANGGELTFRADYRGRSDVFNQTSGRLDNSRLRPEFADLGAQIGWRNADGNLSATLWGKNLLEDVDITNFGPPSPCCSSFAAGFRGKTEFGLTVGYEF